MNAKQNKRTARSVAVKRRGKKKSQVNILGRYGRMAVSNQEDYADFYSSVSPSTTVITSDLLTGVIGVLQANPASYGRLVSQGVNLQWIAPVMITKIGCRLRSTGSVGNAIAASDVYNTLRHTLCYSEVYFSGIVIPPLVNVINALQVQDVSQVLYDITDVLTSQSLTATENAPGMRFREFTIPLNQRIDFYSDVANGLSGWNTKRGKLVLQTVSDSTVTPNPSIDMIFRIYFRPISF